MSPVGTPLAGCPPDRSRRAELPHRAPALGPDGQTPLCCLPYPLQRRLRGWPVLCPGPGASERIALGRPPSLRPLRRRRGRWTLVTPVAAAVVRGHLRYYGAVRLPVLVHRRLAPVGFTTRTATPSRCASGSRPRAGSPSSCPERLRTCMGSTTARGPDASRGSDTPVGSSASGNSLDAPDSNISRLHTQPARSSADACVTASPPRRHGSRPVRVATASPYGACIHYAPSVTGASPRKSCRHRATSRLYPNRDVAAASGARP